MLDILESTTKAVVRTIRRLVVRRCADFCERKTREHKQNAKLISLSD